MPCVSSRLQLCVQNCDHLSPPNPYISETAFSHRFRKAYTYPPPPPKVTTFWCIRPKVEKSLKKCENAPWWQELDVRERYPSLILITHPMRCQPKSRQLSAGVKKCFGGYQQVSLGKHFISYISYNSKHFTQRGNPCTARYF